MIQASFCLSFLLSFMALILNSALLPGVVLTAFAPFLALVYRSHSFEKSLWISLICGLILDLVSSEFHFGMYGLSYSCTCVILFFQKNHFFEEKPLSFSLFSMTISFCLTAFQLLWMYLFEEMVPMSYKSLLTDFIYLPLLDGIYSFLWFVCSIYFYFNLKKIKYQLTTKKSF